MCLIVLFRTEHIQADLSVTFKAGFTKLFAPIVGENSVRGA